jgi:hypothetical protein
MLARVAQKDKRLPGFRAQQWYFFFVATFYLYLRCVHARVCMFGLGAVQVTRGHNTALHPKPWVCTVLTVLLPPPCTLLFVRVIQMMACRVAFVYSLHSPTSAPPPHTHMHAPASNHPMNPTRTHASLLGPLSLPLSVPLPPPAASLRTTCWWSSLRAVPWQRLPGCCGGTPSLAIASTWQVRGACRQAVQVQEIGQAVQGSTMAHGWTGASPFEGGEASGCRGVSARIL